MAVGCQQSAINNRLSAKKLSLRGSFLTPASLLMANG